MLGYFEQNIGVQGTGAVVADPDRSTPGGSYYYHWERDGALTMLALQEISSTPPTEKMKAYSQG